MTHPDKDELIFIYAPKFSSGVAGSPAGELKQFILTPSISMVDLDYYNTEEWDYVYVDKNFPLNDYLYVQKKYNHVIKGMPQWLKETNEV